MEAPWNPAATPIEMFFKIIVDAREFATAGEDPISDLTTVRTMLTIVLDTGLFNEDCKTWRLKHASTQTLALFYTDFMAANNDRLLTATTSSAGYHGANRAEHNPEIAKLQAQIAKLQQLIDQPGQPTDRRNQQSTQRPRLTGRSNTSLYPTSKPTNYPLKLAPGFDWSHGINKHTSLKCQHPLPGHETAATFTNQMGSTCWFVHTRATV